MNYLAHFHLAWPDPQLLAGALEGDYRKGLLRGELPARIEAGVRLHRAIDGYTDNHPVIVELRRRFPTEMRRYAGILIDLSFDHFLSRHWQQFSSLPEPEFRQGVYRCLQEYEAHLSPAAQRMARRMAQVDLLAHYARWDTVPDGAARVGERLRRGNPLRDTRALLARERQPLEAAFLDFYPDLVAFARAAGSD